MAKVVRKNKAKSIVAAAKVATPRTAPALAAKREKRPMAAEPRLGAISPEDFESACSHALGDRGWQKSFRSGTGLAQSTLTRYLRGMLPIPQHIAVLVEMLLTIRNHGLPVPDAFNPKK